jgi:hypothetical protein
MTYYIRLGANGRMRRSKPGVSKNILRAEAKNLSENQSKTTYVIDGWGKMIAAFRAGKSVLRTAQKGPGGGKKTGPLSKKKKKCAAKTVSGKPCKNTALPRRKYCGKHS